MALVAPYHYPGRPRLPRSSRQFPLVRNQPNYSSSPGVTEILSYPSYPGVSSPAQGSRACRSEKAVNGTFVDTKFDMLHLT